MDAVAVVAGGSEMTNEDAVVADKFWADWADDEPKDAHFDVDVDCELYSGAFELIDL